LKIKGQDRRMSDAAHIVIVDDEEDIREMVEEYLNQNGFMVTTAGGGEEFRKVLAETSVDLALLDINMPGEDGLSLARHVRATSDTAVIMLTASGGVVDRIIGLEIGADDYISKPFDPRELLARVRSVLRRTKSGGDAAASSSELNGDLDENSITFGQCVLDLSTRRLRTVGGEDVPITSMEFDLLKAFSEHPNRVLTRDQLLDLAHNRGWEPFDRSIDIRITRLRRKIELDPAKPETIKTIRGAGYMFVTGRRAE
jgi:two-component system phosphate regulon response regulator OmpR